MLKHGRCWIVLLACIVAFAAAGAVSPEEELFNKTFWAVWKAVDQDYYDPKFGGVDWQRVGREYEPKVKQAGDEKSLLALIRQMLAELHASHLSIRTGKADEIGINVTLKRIGGQNFVTDVAQLSDARSVGIRPGDRLLTPSDSLAGPLGTVTQIQVRSCDGRLRKLAVRRQNAMLGVTRPALQWQIYNLEVGRRIGYLRAEYFDEADLSLIDTAMETMARSDALILDLRNSRGGTSVVLKLAGYFSPEAGGVPFGAVASRTVLARLKTITEPVDLNSLASSTGVYSTVELSKLILARGGVKFYTEELKGKVFRKPVIVLVSETTSSAAEALAMFFKNTGKATLVGSATAGKLLVSKPLPLPNGWQLEVPFAAFVLPDGKVFKDTPVQPDVFVHWTRRNLCEGTDPDIAKALNLLAEALRPRPSLASPH